MASIFSSVLRSQTYFLRLMDKILHYLKDPKLWELWYIPSTNRIAIANVLLRTPWQHPLSSWILQKTP